MAVSKKILCILLCLLILIACFSFLDPIFDPKVRSAKYEPFFQCADQLDILFLGSSHMFCGIYPMDMWESHGYTGYDFTVPSGGPAQSYWALVNALDYCTPKLVVMDLYMISSELRVNDHYLTSTFWHNIPLSMNKFKAAFDLYPGSENDRDRFSFLFPFSDYHGRWADLSSADLQAGYSPEKGADHAERHKEAPPPFRNASPMSLSMDALGAQYLMKVQQLCQEKGIELLCTYLPFSAAEAEAAEALGLHKLCGELGIDYINFLELDLLDHSTDLIDNDHANSSGAEKLTLWLADYIAEHYTLADHRGDPAYSNWDRELELYDQMKLEKLAAVDSQFEMMVLLHDPNFSSLIRIGEGSPVYADPLYLEMIKNIAGDELPILERSWAEKSAYVLLADRAAGIVQEYSGDDIPNSIECSEGCISMEGSPKFPEDEFGITAHSRGHLQIVAWPTGGGEHIYRSFSAEDSLHRDH